MAAPAMVVKPSTAAIKATTRKVRAQPSIWRSPCAPRGASVDVAGASPTRQVNVQPSRPFPRRDYSWRWDDGAGRALPATLLAAFAASGLVRPIGHEGADRRADDAGVAQE